VTFLFKRESHLRRSAVVGMKIEESTVSIIFITLVLMKNYLQYWYKKGNYQFYSFEIKSNRNL